VHPLFEQYQTTLLGRLKTRALSELSGSLEKLPSNRELFRRVFAEWKKNSAAGKFYYNLLDTWRIDPIEFPAKFGQRAVTSLLAELNRVEYFERIYAEGRVHGLPETPTVGCLVLGHRRPNDEPGYLASIFPSEDPHRGWFCSVVPSGSKGVGNISVMTKSGWQDIRPDQVTECVAARVTLATLRNHLEKIDPRPIALNEIKSNPADEPPTDAEYMRRIEAAAKKQIAVTTATTSLRKVAPHSIDFCARYKPDRVGAIALRILNGYRPTLAVYWNGSSFVMSDDYPDYLAYKQARCDDVSVAILGEFPKQLVKVRKRGGVELLPPAGLALTGVHPAPLTARFKEWQLEEKYGGRSRKNIPSDLIATWMIFADLLDDDNVDERTLHRFIFKSPEVLTAYGTQFESEVRLGDAYRIDVVVRARAVRDEITLVELENHRHGIFTRDGQPRAEITHAVQQVQDWFRWLRENPTYPFAESLGGLPPAGLVVAGRSRDFDNDERSRLAHLNSGSPVPVITYDELLDRLGDLILARLDAT
jgi:hypothetical protein